MHRVLIERLVNHIQVIQNRVARKIKKGDFTKVYTKDYLEEIMLWVNQSLDFAYNLNIASLKESVHSIILHNMKNINFEKSVSDRFSTNMKMIERIRKIYWTHPGYKIVVIAGAGHIADYVHEDCLCGIATGVSDLSEKIGTLLLCGNTRNDPVYGRFYLNSEHVGEKLNYSSIHPFVQMSYTSSYFGK
jgi:hypothetical protein